MKTAGAVKAAEASASHMQTPESAEHRRQLKRMPVVHCPACDSRAYVRTSEEISPRLRILYYYCSRYECSMRWSATLEVLDVLAPSGLNPDFRPANLKVGKPPGHEFGQTAPAPLLDFLAAMMPPT